MKKRNKYKRDYKVNNDLTLKKDGKLYRLVEGSYACLNCPFNEIAHCDRLCTEVYSSAKEKPKFSYVHTTFVEVNPEETSKNNIIQKAAHLAHEVLTELSTYRQEHSLDPLTFRCEGSCRKFLNIIDDDNK